jgi:hypothetical protein
MTKLHVFLCLIAIFGGRDNATPCTPPRYERGKVYVNSSSEVIMQISLRPSDLDPNKLACLATALHRQHSGARAISVTIYDSFEAARLDRR